MPYLRLLLLCFAVLAPALLWAQEPRQPVRLELPYQYETSHVEVMALPDSSLLVFSRKVDTWARNPDFVLEKYNANLEPVWKSKLDLKSEFEFVRHYTEAPYTYLIFQAAKPTLYTFVRLHLGSGAISQSEVELDKVEYIYEFNVLRGNHFLITGNNYDTKPNLLYLNPEKPQPTILPALYGEESSFSDLHTDHVHGRVDVVLVETNRRVSRLQVKSFDQNGKLLQNYFILQPQDRSLLNAEVTPGDTLSRMLVGTYGARDLRFVQGFFTSPVAFKIAEGEFYSLLDLQNFFKYMKPRREERTRKREFARIAEGKEPLQRYRMLLHDLIETPRGYVLAAEIYFPQFRSNSGYFNSRIRGLEREAQAYKRTHAIALGFDRDGVLLWDNAFPLPDLLTPSLIHAVEVAALTDGRVVMAYPDKEKIVYRLMEQNKFTDKETSVELLPYEKEEKITSTDIAGLIRWYGPHFAAFGFQRVRTPDGPNRTVFYINKISF
ncbi:hypothetical protein K3G39_18375 [Pontibacter sp. HSC-14F20]|uniref:hypothetical protein n=1 Tax=Pontibacter sp. HSC-14F20 TaxID=2864136 RepID=UPI001C73C4B1|nr:hypothetical protein [Pontibacter sp. HSC-14F20]MBX0335205.1 hypothetical protein [Pontibacter sp. HSC-14F20]